MKQRLSDTGTTWVCPGWDGEGCDYQAPPQEWRQIGIAGPVWIEITPLTLHG